MREGGCGVMRARAVGRPLRRAGTGHAGACLWWVGGAGACACAWRAGGRACACAWRRRRNRAQELWWRQRRVDRREGGGARTREEERKDVVESKVDDTHSLEWT